MAARLTNYKQEPARERGNRAERETETRSPTRAENRAASVSYQGARAAGRGGREHRRGRRGGRRDEASGADGARAEHLTTRQAATAPVAPPPLERRPGAPREAPGRKGGTLTATRGDPREPLPGWIAPGRARTASRAPPRQRKATICKSDLFRFVAPRAKRGKGETQRKRLAFAKARAKRGTCEAEAVVAGLGCWM